jgi:multisubunit Na+/H+ antiporter MnhB subunit
MNYLIAAILLLILFYLVYSIFKTKQNIRFKQISAAIVSSVLLLFLLYTCKTDNYF